MRYEKVLFIADMFRDDLNGGAESNDSVLISHLRKTRSVVCLHSADVLPKLFEGQGASTFVILGNFTALKEESRQALIDSGVPYMIYEHDHKYLSTRDPSVFKNFLAPKKEIINSRLYENAKSIVVLSKICKEVIEKNLGINNVHSIGSSLWTDAKLDFLDSLADVSKINETAILNSNNPIKGVQQAKDFCTRKGLTYTQIHCADDKGFAKKLATYERLVFMPQVLETFSRLACEAKMLNCKLVTKPSMLGFGSEACFSLSGRELIVEMRRRVKAALAFFDGILESKETREDVTVILNCYKRSHLLAEQIAALQTQSVKPEDIWVWVNAGEEVGWSWLESLGVKVFKSNHNWKFFGRFAAAMLAKTKYIAMFDDDTLPGKDWLSNCLQTMKTHRGILGGVGCVLPGERYQGHHRVGWSNPSSQVTEVDLVGHAWFFEKEWMKYFWMEDPSCWENGEDIHFSYMAQKYGNIRTFVPPQDPSKPETMSSLKGMEYGVDDVATSVARNHEVFYRQRDEIVKKACDGGWKLVKERLRT